MDSDSQSVLVRVLVRIVVRVVVRILVRIVGIFLVGIVDVVVGIVAFLGITVHQPRRVDPVVRTWQPYSEPRLLLYCVYTPPSLFGHGTTGARLPKEALPYPL